MKRFPRTTIAMMAGEARTGHALTARLRCGDVEKKTLINNLLFSLLFSLEGV